MTAAIVLASSSPFRRALLARLGLPFESVSPNIDETPEPGEAPEDLARRLAIAKARAVADRHPTALIIGSDQVAECGGILLGKPHDHSHAVEQLRTVSGKTMTLHTGLALLDAASGRVQCEVIPVRVQFRALTDAQIENYLRKEQPYDCTGSVKSEGLGIALLERFEGEDPNAMIGLPLIHLVRMLERESVAII